MYHFSNAVDKKARASTYSTSSRSVVTDPQCYRPRHYHPGLGRFVQRDPLGYTDTANLSAYVASNPATLLDPSGLKVLNDWSGWDTKDWHVSGKTLTTGKNMAGNRVFGDVQGDRPVTTDEIKVAFVMTFEFRFLDGYVPPGKRADGRPIDPGLGYYGNSGVYIYNAIEVNIIDTTSILKHIRRLKNLPDNAHQFQEDGSINLPGWKPEYVYQLLVGYPYKGPRVTEPNNLGKYELPHEDWMDYMDDINPLNEDDPWNKMEIYFKPCFSKTKANVLESYVLMTKVNGTIMQGKQEISLPTKSKMALADIKDFHVYLQSHHGSQVEFRNMVIKTGANAPAF